MRKLIVSEFVTLDGVMEGPGPMDHFEFAGWTMPYMTDEIMKFKSDELFASDALLIGRITYEGFAAAWPTMKGTGEFGEKMNSMAKFVASTMPQRLDWKNSQLLKGDAIPEIAKLKQQSGKDILVAGSGGLVQTLIAANLIDEYRLLVYPITLGAGKRLFREKSRTKLTLVETKKFSSGVVLLRYTPEK